MQLGSRLANVLKTADLALPVALIGVFSFS